MNTNEEYQRYRDPKSCFLPTCQNNDNNNPNKKFINIRKELKGSWCLQVNRKCPKRALYCCEDHIDLKEDLENYEQSMNRNAIPKLKTNATLKNIPKTSHIRHKIQLTRVKSQHTTTPTREPDSRSVTPITDPEGDETETKPQLDDVKEDQDPLSLGSAQGSSEQLSGLTQLYVQPSTSSEPVVKEEFDEETFNYKDMYFKLLEEITELKNQQRYQENLALVETNKSIGKELENLVETNQKYINDIQHLLSENQKLTDRNQSLSENVQFLSDKIEELTKKNEEERTKEVDIFRDYKNKIDDLNEQIRRLAEENERLQVRNKTLAESLRKFSKENQRLKKKNTLQRKFIQRLKNHFNNKLNNKSNLIKALRHSFTKLKTVNVRLQRRVAVNT